MRGAPQSAPRNGKVRKQDLDEHENKKCEPKGKADPNEAPVQEWGSRTANPAMRGTEAHLMRTVGTEKHS